jgi:hypothetical protein
MFFRITHLNIMTLSFGVYNMLCLGVVSFNWLDRFASWPCLGTFWMTKERLIESLLKRPTRLLQQ